MDVNSLVYFFLHWEHMNYVYLQQGPILQKWISVLFFFFFAEFTYLVLLYFFKLYLESLVKFI